MANMFNHNEVDNTAAKRPLGECISEIASTLWQRNVVEPVNELISRNDVHHVNHTYAMARGVDNATFDAYNEA